MSGRPAVAAARSTAALFRLEDRSVLDVSGADRIAFLQGQLTNDVAVLDARSSCQALALTREGRIVADLRVVARTESLWLESDARLAAAAIERLEKYVVADDVAIADASDRFARFAIEGPRAQSIVATATGTSISLAPDQVADLGFGDASVVAVAWSLTGGLGLQIFAPRAIAEPLWQALLASGRAAGGTEGEAADLETLRIEAGVPRAGAEIGTDTLPAELHLVDRAVSFTKGCFTGQEVVTRMQSRGRVGHVMVGVAFDDAASLPPPGAALDRDGARAGEITSVALSPTAGPIGLAIVRKGWEAPGTELRAAGRIVRVAALPFVPIPGRS